MRFVHAGVMVQQGCDTPASTNVVETILRWCQAASTDCTSVRFEITWPGNIEPEWSGGESSLPVSTCNFHNMWWHEVFRVHKFIYAQTYEYMYPFITSFIDSHVLIEVNAEMPAQEGQSQIIEWVQPSQRFCYFWRRWWDSMRRAKFVAWCSTTTVFRNESSLRHTCIQWYFHMYMYRETLIDDICWIFLTMQSFWLLSHQDHANLNTLNFE